MLEVKFYSLDIYKGSVVLTDDGRLQAKPADPKYNTFFENVMADGVGSSEGVFLPSKDPKGWITHLWCEYHGQVSASKAVEVSADAKPR